MLSLPILWFQQSKKSRFLIGHLYCHACSSQHRFDSSSCRFRHLTVKKQCFNVFAPDLSRKNMVCLLLKALPPNPSNRLTELIIFFSMKLVFSYHSITRNRYQIWTKHAGPSSWRARKNECLPNQIFGPLLFHPGALLSHERSLIKYTPLSKIHFEKYLRYALLFYNLGKTNEANRFSNPSTH